MGIVDTFASIAAPLLSDLSHQGIHPNVLLRSVSDSIPSHQDLSAIFAQTKERVNNARTTNIPKALPDHWERVRFTVGDEPMMCIHAPVRGSEDPMYAILGLKDTVGYNVDYIRLANRMGRSVIALELPDYGEEIGYMPFFREIGEKFLITDPPLQREYNGTRRHNISHSTGGHIELHHLMDEGSAREMAKNSVSSTFVSPFGTASFATSSISNIAYRQYANLVPKYRYGDTIPDRIHALINHMRGHPPLSERGKRMTHEQVVYMVDECSPLIENIRKNGFPDAAKQRVNAFIIGMKDFVSDPATNKDIANKLGVEPSFHCEGWHAPHTERPNAQQAIDRVIKQAALMQGTTPERFEDPLDRHVNQHQIGVFL